MSSLELFQTLPPSLRRRIDDAWNAAANPQSSHSLSTLQNDKYYIETAGVPSESALSSGGGGFLVEEPAPSGGGFIVEDTNSENESEVSQLPLSLIPTALQLLDLPPDDGEVLAVFRNAASGWSLSSNNTQNSPNLENDQFVSKDDWRSVCAVLLESAAVEDSYEDSDPNDETYRDNTREQDDEEEAISELSEQDSNDDDEDYIDEPSRFNSLRRPHPSVSRVKSPVSNDQQRKDLTPRQEQACLDAFALFFPDVSASELPDQKIMIKDVQRVAKVLGEKIKADEIVDMLEMFSSSLDKSLNFRDFGRMMVAAKLA